MSIVISLAILQAVAAATPANPVAATPSDDAKKVCKTISPTGSRLGGKRVCMTKAEWGRMGKDGEEAAREIQDTFSKPAEGN